MLTIDATKAHDAAGGNLSGGNYVFGKVTGENFFRFYGDWNGDRHVNNTDFNHFTATMNKAPGQTGYLWYMDYTTNNIVNNSDFQAFALRMNKQMVFVAP